MRGACSDASKRRPDRRGGAARTLRAAFVATLALFAVAGASLPRLAGRFVSRDEDAGAPLGGARGVRLGMSAAQVESSFDDAPRGSWSFSESCGGVALEWTATAASAETEWARFEMHDGMLVAIRLHTRDRTMKEGAWQGPLVVRQVRRVARGSAVTILARGCVTHEAEAQQIAIAAMLGT